MIESRKDIDWDSLGFNVIPTKSMFKSECFDGYSWPKGKLIPYATISLSPAATVLNYAQSIFEGMKAHRSIKNRIVLFRPDQNAKRIAKSAQRICIPIIDEDYFINAVNLIVCDNAEFIPPLGKGGMYIRPLAFGVSPFLGVRPSKEYIFMIFCTPVGHYFKNGSQLLNLLVTDKYHRAAPKGIGNAKASGNYSASLLPGQEARAQGFDEVIYLSAANENLVEEMGAANLFAVSGKTLKTPSLGKSILPGINRDSAICIAKEILGLSVEEGDLTIDELLAADEVFCTGTAAVIGGIGKITKDDREYIISNGRLGQITDKIKKYLIGIQLEEIEDPFGWVYPL